MNNWNSLAKREIVEKTMQSLKANGIDALYVSTGEQAKNKVLAMIPKGVEVMTMTSVTTDTIGLTKEINESGNYISVRKKLMSMNRQTESDQMQKLGAAPQFAIGSVHAVTEDGKVLIASNTGSQLAAYVYGAGHVIWIVGTQKIVKDVDEGMKRIYEHSLILESERAKKAYGMPGSSVNKVLIVNKEVTPKRITIIFVNEVLGF